MKVITSLLILALMVTSGCVRKKAEPEATDPHAGIDMSKGDPHAGMNMGDPHAGMNMGARPGGLDLDAMMSTLPEGWTKTQPASTMRLAQINLAPTKGDTAPAELAVFHFPGTGGSAQANIVRWQNQFKGPKGETGSEVARTDTMMAGLLTIVTTDVSGTQLAQNAMMGTGPTSDMPGYRMLASVIETPSGPWFIKVTGPQKTVSAHEAKIREFVKRAKVKEGGVAANPHAK